MKVTQEKLPDSQLSLEIEISGQSSQQSYDEVLKNLGRTANIPGFRKGKVPRQILLQRLGANYIKAAALEKLIQKSLEDAIAQEKIESLGNYQLKSNFEELVQAFAPGQALVFSATIDVPPTLELGDYRSLKVQAEEVPYNPETLENWLEERQVKLATLVPIEDRPAAMGDLAVIDYQAHTDDGGKKGEAIDGVQGTDFNVDLEEGRFVKGMVEGIVGMTLNQTKEVAVVFPDDYPREDLADKPVIFEITLKDLKARELPELDDDFAEEVSEFSSIEELRKSLEKQFRDQAAESTKDNIQKALVKALIDICPVDLPNSLIQEEITRILTQMAAQFEQMGVDVRQLFTQENIPNLRENARSDAIANLKRTLIIEAIAKQEGIEADKTELQAKLTAMKAELSSREVDFERLEQFLAEEAIAEKTLAWLQEQVTVDLVSEGSLQPPEKGDDGAELVAGSPESKAIVEEPAADSPKSSANADKPATAEKKEKAKPAIAKSKK